MTLADILTLCGGLGLFLFGMKHMSESIEKAAGAKLRKILEIFTTNKFAGWYDIHCDSTVIKCLYGHGRFFR